MAETDKTGWAGVSARDLWRCPECGATSPVEDWDECEAYCEDCGEHDARKCPVCDEIFDHVWDSIRIEEASAKS